MRKEGKRVVWNNPFAGMTFRAKNEELKSAQNVPRLVNDFDTKKKNKINLPMKMNNYIRSLTKIL